MKRIISLLLTSLILFSLGSCGRAPTYSDDKDCPALATNALNALQRNEADYSTADEYFLSDYFSTPSYVRDSVIRFASNSNNLDEFGIFHVSDGNAETMAEHLRDYLLKSYEKNRTWYDSYIPAETPKLRDAEIRIYGNYIVYAILQKDAKNALFQFMEEQLKIQ